LFEQMTWENILRRLLDQVATPGIAKQEGTFVYDALSPAAIELAVAYTQLDRVLAMGFAQTSAGENLDMRAEEHGVIRKPAVAATGEVRLMGEAGTVVPKETVLSTRSGTLFRTVEQAVVPSAGEVKVAVRAVEAGSAGNVPAGLITELPQGLSGITAVVQDKATDGGYDGETDEALLERLLARVRQPATSGNANHYMQWALEVPGIGGAKVFPLWNGPGTVKVVLLDEHKTAPDAAVVDAVTSHIEELRPVGAAVTVVAATEVPIHVSVDVTLAGGAVLDTVKQLIEDGLREYLKSLAFADPMVRYTRISNVISDIPSVVDYADLKVNGGVSNVQIQSGEVAVLGTVSVV